MQNTFLANCKSVFEQNGSVPQSAKSHRARACVNYPLKLALVVEVFSAVALNSKHANSNLADARFCQNVKTHFGPYYPSAPSLPSS